MLFASAIGFSLILAGCSEPTSSSAPATMNIYLLSDTTTTLTEAISRPIYSLDLAGAPVISSGDLVFYKWADHKFELTAEKRQETERFFATHGNGNGHTPFVLSVGAERIYIGSFMSIYSSFLPDVPYVTSSLETFTINAGVGIAAADPRNDERIRKALQEAGILID